VTSPSSIMPDCGGRLWPRPWPWAGPRGEKIGSDLRVADPENDFFKTVLGFAVVLHPRQDFSIDHGVDQGQQDRPKSWISAVVTTSSLNLPSGTRRRAQTAQRNACFWVAT